MIPMMEIQAMTSKLLVVVTVMKSRKTTPDVQTVTECIHFAFVMVRIEDGF